MGIRGRVGGALALRVPNPWPSFVVAGCLAMALGLLATRQLSLAVGVSVLLVVAGLTACNTRHLAALTVMIVTGIPVFSVATSVAARRPILSLGYGNASVPLQVALPVAVGLLTLVSLSQQRMGDLIRRLWGRSTKYVVVWELVALVVFLLGVRANGLVGAVHDYEYYMLWLWIVVPLALFSKGRGALRPVIVWLIAGAAASAFASLVIFSVPALKTAVYGTTSYASTNRVGFGSAALYVLLLPVCVVLTSHRGIAPVARFGLIIASVLMVGSLAVSQSRAFILTAALNVCLALAMPHFKALGANRTRALVQTGLVVSLAICALGMSAVLGLRAAQQLPSEVGLRLRAMVQYSQIPNFQYRQRVNADAISVWRANVKSTLVGLGAGATFRVYDVSNTYVVDERSSLDNAWSTMAVKGGLLAISGLAGLIAALFFSFLRAWRRSANPFERAVWATLSVSFPAFILESTYSTSHFLTVPSVIIGLSSLLAAAELACHSRSRVRVECGREPWRNAPLGS